MARFKYKYYCCDLVLFLINVYVYHKWVSISGNI